MKRPYAIRRAAVFRSADEWTIVGFLPPSSSTAGVRFFAAAWWMILPTGGLPVKKIRSHCCSSSAVVSGMPPPTTVTASGSRYFGIISAVCSADASETSDGFRTAVFPPATAATSGASVSMYGSFQAPMTKRHAERVVAHSYVARLHHQWRVDVVLLHPPVQMVERVIRLANVVVDVHQIGVDLVAAQVVPERLVHGLAVLVDHRLDRLQLLDSPGHGSRVPRLEVRPLALDQARVVGLTHVSRSFHVSAASPVF